MVSWSPGLWISSLPSASWTLSSHDHCSQGCLFLRISNKPLGGEYAVQQSTSPCWAPLSFGWAVVNAIQQPPAWLMSCCVVPLPNIRVVEVSHEDQGRQMWGCFYLSVEGLICLLFLVRWPIGNPHYNGSLTCILSNPNIELGNYVTKYPAKNNQMLFIFSWSMLFICLRETYCYTWFSISKVQVLFFITFPDL